VKTTPKPPRNLSRRKKALEVRPGECWRRDADEGLVGERETRGDIPCENYQSYKVVDPFLLTHDHELNSKRKPSQFEGT